MPRKGWNALSAGYKARLQKAGITETDYNTGTSIKAARGHLSTPERPTAANPKVHTRYISERDKLINKIVRNKDEYFSTAPKWNPVKAGKPFRDNPPTLALLRKWAALSKEEWLDALRESDGTVDYLGYH